jgi:hypothetical protein
MSSIGYLGRFFETAALPGKAPQKKFFKKNSKKSKSLIKNQK